MASARNRKLELMRDLHLRPSWQGLAGVSASGGNKTTDEVTKDSNTEKQKAPITAIPRRRERPGFLPAPPCGFFATDAQIDGKMKRDSPPAWGLAHPWDEIEAGRGGKHKRN